MADEDPATQSKEMQALISLEKRFSDFALLASEELTQIRVTLQVILGLQKLAVAKAGLDEKEIDELCRLSYLKAQTLYEEEILTRLKALLKA